MTMIATEAQEQSAVIAWAQIQSRAIPELAWLYHTPNGGSRHKLEAVSLKRQGVRAGVPDLTLPVPRNGHHGLYVEMKRTKGSTTSPEQRHWIAYLNDAGYKAVICKGFDEARDTILDYLGKKI